MEKNEERSISIISNASGKLLEHVKTEFEEYRQDFPDEYEIDLCMYSSEGRKEFVIRPSSESLGKTEKRKKYIDFIDPFPITSSDFHKMTKLANICYLTGDISFSDAIAIGKLPLHEFCDKSFYIEFYEMVINNVCKSEAVRKRYQDVYKDAFRYLSRAFFHHYTDRMTALSNMAKFPILRTSECREIQKRAVEYLRVNCSIEDLLVKTAQSVLDPRREKPKWMNRLSEDNVQEISEQEVEQCGVTSDDNFYYDYFKMVYEKNIKLLCDKKACREDERFWPD